LWHRGWELSTSPKKVGTAPTDERISKKNNGKRPRARRLGKATCKGFTIERSKQNRARISEGELRKSLIMTGKVGRIWELGKLVQARGQKKRG